jgi:CMP-N-acetylneuraminic acid synthetase
MIILIPARRDSKGLPFKNRKLFNCTISKIPQEFREKVYVYTDDEVLEGWSRENNLNYVPRDLASDEQTTKEMAQSFVEKLKLESEDIVMLYLTYPDRDWEEIQRAIDTYRSEAPQSLLGKKAAKTHPYLCMYESESGRGTQVVKHDVCRRQEYPDCFEISHQVCIFNSAEVDKLNNNLFNENTLFFLVSGVVDVDNEEDLGGVKSYVN